MPKTQEETSLKELVNTPRVVAAFGKTYEIKKLTLGPASRALEYIGPFGFLLQNLFHLPRDKKGMIKAAPEEMLNLAVTAVSISGPSALGLISVFTSEPVEWLEEQDTMDGLEVLAAGLEMNLDFFSQANIERAKGLFARLQQAIPALGGDTVTT